MSERKPGFYIFKNTSLVEEILYISGERRGNKYARHYPDNEYQMNWYSLLWNCVPSQAKLDEQYDYHAEMPDGWWGPLPIDTEEDHEPAPANPEKKQIFLCSDKEPGSRRTCMLQPGHLGMHSAIDDFGGEKFW